MTVPGDFSGGNRQAGALRLPDCSSLFSRDIVIANRPKVIEIRKNKQHLGSSKGHTIATGAVKQSVSTRGYARAIHHPSSFKIDFQNVSAKIPLKFPLCHKFLFIDYSRNLKGGRAPITACRFMLSSAITW